MRFKVKSYSYSGDTSRLELVPHDETFSGPSDPFSALRVTVDGPKGDAASAPEVGDVAEIDIRLPERNIVVIA